MMYLHGFMSGANGSKQRQLQEQFKGRYRVVAPELTANPVESLRVINEMIDKENPEIIIGTSLGGWMALECRSNGADVIAINPVLDPQRQLARWLNQEQKYFCPRLDGVQTYTLTPEVLALYGDFDAKDSVRYNRLNISALCSSADELLGDSHYSFLRDILPEGFCEIVDDFGHQCRDAGLIHLYALIEKVISRRRMIEDSKMDFSEFEEMVRNRPLPDTPGCFRLSIMDAKSSRIASGYYADFEDAHAEMMSRRCDDLDVTFKIERLGFGQVATRQFPVDEWLYDCQGRLLQRAACSSFHYHTPGIYGKFFGHLPELQPFKEGKPVYMRTGKEEAKLAVVVSEPRSLEEGYENYCQEINYWLREGNAIEDWLDIDDYASSDNDEVFIQFGPYEDWMRNFAFVHPMSLVPVLRPLTPIEEETLTGWYQAYKDSIKRI